MVNCSPGLFFSVVLCHTLLFYVEGRANAAGHALPGGGGEPPFQAG